MALPAPKPFVSAAVKSVHAHGIPTEDPNPLHKAGADQIDGVHAPEVGAGPNPLH